MNMADVKEKLGKAEKYWQMGFNGDYSMGPALSVIAMAMRKADEEGQINREELLASERQTLNRLLIVAHCPICKPRIGGTIEEKDV